MYMCLTPSLIGRLVVMNKSHSISRPFQTNITSNLFDFNTTSSMLLYLHAQGLRERVIPLGRTVPCIFSHPQSHWLRRPLPLKSWRCSLHMLSSWTTTPPLGETEGGGGDGIALKGCVDVWRCSFWALWSCVKTIVYSNVNILKD